MKPWSFFFVLSGYVIAHSASQPGKGAFDYVYSRFVRIAPVAWAALLLGLLASLGRQESSIAATLANMLFIGQSGFWAIEAPMNPAYWSLNYEVWYYVIFGVWMFSPRKHRVAFTLLAMLLAGPKILLLFPVWLFGVWLYWKMPQFGRSTAVILIAASMTAAVMLFWFEVSASLRDWLYAIFPPAWRFHYSTQVLYDLLLGVVVCTHFAAVASLGRSLVIPAGLERPVRYLASFTFSIYIFHSPLNFIHLPGMSAWQFYGLLAVCIFGLAQITERRVQFFRGFYKREQRPG